MLKFPREVMAGAYPAHNQLEITQLLVAWRSGDGEALDRLMPLVYSELKRIARNLMRRQKPGHTLQPTALVNEAYLNLIDSNRVNWQDRTHFFAMAARVMRRILVDSARRRARLKRAGAENRITLDERIAAQLEQPADLIALDDALRRLEALNERQARIVELRYFAGLTEEQIARMLDVSERTVRRDWTVARAFLFRQLETQAVV